jgi:putative phosphoesterase
MKILIVSDSHDNYEKLSAAISAGNETGCEVMLHSGDFVSPPTLENLKDFNGKVYLVWGNNEGEKVGFVNKIVQLENTEIKGNVMEKDIDGLKFYMNHYPDIVENAALTGKYDVCIYGHNHIYHEEVLSNGTILLNPGAIHGWKTGVCTCIVFDTKIKTVEKITL